MQLLERHEQLATLERCLQQARAGCGKLVLIAGPAGFGKSSLVEHFVLQPRADSCALWGACDALSTPRALGPVHEIAAQIQMSATQRARAEQSRDGLFRSLLEEFARPERVCLVVLEDMHWADEATLDFLGFVGRRIQRTRALLIATYREDELALTHPVRLALGELTGDHVARVGLAPLSLTALQELTRGSGQDAAGLHRITGGNPFFVREVLASPDQSVPQTVRDAVLARLMRCSAAVRELAELVSMSPGRTPHWLVESIVGRWRAVADEGGSHGLLLTHNDAVSFRHELARLAVHSTVAAERARTLHARLLQALIAHGADASELVHHATLADDAAAVLQYAPLAGKEAARLGSHREAAAHFDAALRYSASLPLALQAELLERHAEECSVINHTARAIASGTAALALWRQLDDASAQSRVASFLAPEYRMTGDREQADRCIADAIALLQPLPHSAQLAQAYNARARLASNRGQDQEAVAFAQRALEMAREFGDSSTEVLALNYIGTSLLIAGDLAGYEPLERSLALALERDLQECAARAYCNLVFCGVLGHDMARAQRYLDKGLAYCGQRGMDGSAAFLRACGARLALDRGDWDEAAHTAVELSQIDGLMPLLRVPTWVTLGLVHARRGDAGADEWFDEALELALPMGEPERVARVTAARAELAWYRGDLDRVAREAGSGLRHLEGLRFPWARGELLWWQSRRQSITPVAEEIAEPWRLMLAGDWRAAAAAWQHYGMPYEQALALAEGPEPALRDALAILERIGAGPLAAIVRRRLRELGVRGVPRGPNETTRAHPAGLTARETQVLALLAQGCSNAQLARRLHRSIKTIDHHVSAILEKLGVRSRAEAIAAAYARGIVSPGCAASPPAPR